MQRVVHSSLHFLRKSLAAIPTDKVQSTNPPLRHFRIVPGFRFALELHSNGAESETWEAETRDFLYYFIYF